MSIHELQDLVAQGEGLHIEFKRKLPEWEKLVREMVAFANTEGGYLLIGVDDDGSICGVRDAQEVDEALAMYVDGYIHPGLNFKVQTVALTPKRSVVVIDVPVSIDRPHRALEKPVFSDLNTGQVLIRLADNSVKASKEMVEILKFNARPRGIKVEIGDKEQKLLKYLAGKPQVTVAEFARFAGIPMPVASRTLVHLVKGNVLRICPQVQGDDWFEERESQQ